MTKLILARHGETTWNVEEIFRGRTDVDLNETGIRQAQLLSEYLRDEPIEAVYSSPLKRALRTAEAVATPHWQEVKITGGLVDMDFGEWQGMPLREVREKFRELFQEWADSPETVVMTGGESLDDVGKRSIGVVNKAVARYEGTVVLVSHRVVNKVLICALLGLDNSHFWEIRQDTCAITTFDYTNGRFVLAGHNDTSHLKPLKADKLADF